MEMLMEGDDRRLRTSGVELGGRAVHLRPGWEPPVAAWGEDRRCGKRDGRDVRRPGAL